MASINEKSAGVTEFLKSNNLVAKVAFIILLIIVFLILFNLGVKLITYIVEPSKSPFIIDGMINSQNSYEIYQDPENEKAIPIYRSYNERSGIEFTWSVWVYIDSNIDNNIDSANGTADNAISTTDTREYHVFSKGNYDEEDSAACENAPGLYIKYQEPSYKFVVKMDTYGDTPAEIEVENITLGKWLNVMIRAKNNAIDVYVNGTVIKQEIIETVPKQNYNNIYVTQDGGYQGNLSDLRYFDYALNLTKIHSIVESGPNLEMADSNSKSGHDIDPPYLSFKWFLNQNSTSAL